MGEALYAHQTAGYGYADDILKKNKTWVMLSPEQQGQLMEDAYQFGYFSNKQWNDPRFNGTDQATFIKYMPNVLQQLHAGQGAT